MIHCYAFLPKCRKNALDLMDVLGNIYAIVLVDIKHKLCQST